MSVHNRYFFVPTIHRRYLNRATYLRRHPPFRKFLDRERDEWSARYPGFRLSERSSPSDSWGFLGADTPHPPRLVTALRAIAGIFDKPHFNQEDRERYSEVQGARLHWRNRMREVCDIWWPPEYYPNPIGHHRFHPALAFVGGCMIYHIDLVPDSWIQPRVSGVQAISFDPGDIDNIPEAVFYRTLFQSTLKQLNSVLESGNVITPEVIEGSVRNAFQEAIDRRGAVSVDFKYVPIYPGMTTSDWRALEPIVQESLNNFFDDEPLDAIARRLISQGMSIRSAAGLLGVSRRTIERMLGRL